MTKVYRPDRVQREKQRRILVAAYAYAYEVENDPIVSDAEYDAIAEEIDPSIETGHAVLDKFFRTKYSPYTGQWVWKHPDYETLERLCRKIRSIRRK